MFLFKGLHSLAAARGDGLRPELQELAEGRKSLDLANVVNLERHLDSGFRQAGPNPRITLDGELPPNVVPFRKIEQNDQELLG